MPTDRTLRTFTAPARSRPARLSRLTERPPVAPKPFSGPRRAAPARPDPARDGRRPLPAAQRAHRSGARGASQEPSSRFYCRLAARLAAAHYEIKLADISARTRGSRGAARARQVAMYLAHIAFRLPLAAVAAGFNRDRATAAYACRVIEDMRDDPAFDAALAGLELTAGVLFGQNGMESAE